MDRLFLKGLPVSSGVGIGEFYVFKSKKLEINQDTVDKRKIKNEHLRLNNGIKNTLMEFQDLKNNLGKKLVKQSDLIFEVYETILGDSFFIEEIKNLITEKRYYADNAVDICIKRYIKDIEESDNEYIKQRIFDLNDISMRILRNMSEDKTVAILENIYHKQIIAVRELTPSLAAALGRKKVSGIVAFEGAAYFSHSAIILRSLGIPVLNDINYDFVNKFDRQPVVIDGKDGFLIINPDKSDVDRYRTILKSNIKKQKELLSKKFKPALTRDGYRINISANISDIGECDEAREKNADGIGLVRTELLFAADGKIPDEREQTLMYSKIVKKMGNRPIVIRTADVGEEKTLGYSDVEINFPIQNSRSIKNSLVNKEQFLAQIRAILCCAEFGNVSISFPLINDIEEIREIKEVIKLAEDQIEAQGIPPFKRIKIGAFIETKQGMNNLDELLPELDFISLGTNDLLQHTLGKDRKQSRVKNDEYFNPEFLKAVQLCISKANQQNKSVSVCGEMAADPAAAVLLFGMGANDLSMSPSKILDVKGILGKLSLAETRQLAEASLECSGIKEVKRILAKKLGKFKV